MSGGLRWRPYKRERERELGMGSGGFSDLTKQDCALLESVFGSQNPEPCAPAAGVRRSALGEGRRREVAGWGARRGRE